MLGNTNSYADYDSYAAGKANVGLDNLAAAGQMIIDSQNGTISNCILEIPQNIKCEINDSTLTLKSGSILTRAGSTYGTITLTRDNVWEFNLPIMGDDKAFVFSGGNGHTPNPKSVSRAFSGNSSSYPNNPQDGDLYFNTTDMTIYIWRNNLSAWETYVGAYPFCVIEIKNHQLSFAKDSNGNDMIFNGAGYIGHHAFIYPNVKALVPNGFNEDGSLKSNLFINQSLQIIELKNPSYETNWYYPIQLNAGGAISRPAYRSIETKDELLQQGALIQYVKSDNKCYLWDGTSYGTQNWCPFVDYNYNDTTVTDFTIRQPYEGAANLLTKDIKEQIGDIDTILHNINSGS